MSKQTYRLVENHHNKYLFHLKRGDEYLPGGKAYGLDNALDLLLETIMADAVAAFQEAKVNVEYSPVHKEGI